GNPSVIRPRWVRAPPAQRSARVCPPRPVTVMRVRGAVPASNPVAKISTSTWRSAPLSNRTPVGGMGVVGGEQHGGGSRVGDDLPDFAFEELAQGVVGGLVEQQIGEARVKAQAA